MNGQAVTTEGTGASLNASEATRGAGLSREEAWALEQVCARLAGYLTLAERSELAAIIADAHVRARVDILQLETAPRGQLVDRLLALLDEAESNEAAHPPAPATAGG